MRNVVQVFVIAVILLRAVALQAGEYTPLPAFDPYATGPAATSPYVAPNVQPWMPGGPAWPVMPANEGVQPRAGAGHLAGEDVGLGDGFTWMQGFVPLFQWRGDRLLFGDGRALFYNDGSSQYGANAALGYRVYDPVSNRTWGGYAGYDHRHTDPFNFGQVSAGFELLGPLVDVHANAYAIVSGRGEKTASVSNLRYDGHNILVDALLVRAMSGFDTDFSLNLTPQSPNFEVRPSIGFYGFFDDKADDAWGVRGQLETSYWTARGTEVTLEASLQDDKVFGTTGFFAVSFLFGSGSYGGSPRTPATRLGDPLKKNMHVVVRQRQVEGAPAINPRTGAPWEVLHFDSTAAAGGTGTFEAPLDSLSTPGADYDIALLHAGSLFNGQSITIDVDHQRLLGDGAANSHLFATQFGTLELPRANTLITRPIIEEAPGNAVTIADATTGVEVSGLNIIDAGQHGIAGRDLVDFNINRNSISGSGDTGVFLEGDNQGVLSGNVASENDDDGFFIESLVDGSISANTAIGNDDQGLDIETLAGGSVSGNTSTDNDQGFVVGTFSGGTMSNNIASENEEQGFLLGTLSGGTLLDNLATGNDEEGFLVGDLSDGSVSGNESRGNVGGLAIGTLSGGEVIGNTAIDNMTNGFAVETFSGGSMSDNTATENGFGAGGRGFNVLIFSGGTLSRNAADSNDVGMAIGTFSGGTMEDNTAMGNGLLGFAVESFQDGMITANTASDSGNDGFLFDFISGGTLSGNMASENDFSGFRFLDVSGGTIDGNSAIGNVRDGFAVLNLSGGTIRSNTATGNQSDGFEIGSEQDGTVVGSWSAGAVTDNIANDNSSFGFRINNRTGGSASGNTASGNDTDNSVP